MAHARTFMNRFVEAHNHDHHHAGTGLHIPADVHYGHAGTVATQRSTTLTTAHAAHPERFSATCGPKILQLPTDTWINLPAIAEPAAA